MRAVNLLPRDEAPKSFAAKRGVVFGGAGGEALATAVLASMMMSAGGAASSKQEELDSIRAQTVEDWICVISDDCSSPERFAELERLVAGDPRFVVSRSPRRLGF